MTRPEKLNEMLDLLLVLQYSQSGKTYDELQEMYGFGRRRLERMMSVLSEKFGDRIETVDNTTDKKKHFRLRKGTINPFIKFSADEINLLEQLKNSLNNEFQQKQLNDLISKIKAINPKNSSSIETDIQYLLESQGYAIRQCIKEKVDSSIYEILSTAILEQRKIQFDYKTVKGHKFRATIHPYAIQYWEKNYLVGFDEYSNKIIKFSIQKIKNLVKLDDYFEKDENFNLKEYSEQSFGIFNSEPMDVKLLFDKSIKEAVFSYQFHPKQTIKETNDGILVEFTASGETEICWNLFKWDELVKIISPNKLVNHYKMMLKSILNKY